jgi:type IV pilus assembly protein PilV
MPSINRNFPGGPPRLGTAGFGLVEVLVALAVGAIALLGAAVVAVDGLRAGGAALRATAATNLAADMAGRIRANRRAIAAYADAGPGWDAGCSADGTTCTPAEVAADDRFHWQAAIEAQLPRGAAAAIEAGADGSACPCTVEVNWPEPGAAHPARVRLVLP